MAELSRFYGIIIRMFAEAGGKHHTPHFHAICQENEAVYSIAPVQLISGVMPTKQQRLLKHGQRFTSKNYSLTGDYSKMESALFRLHLSVRRLVWNTQSIVS